MNLSWQSGLSPEMSQQLLVFFVVVCLFVWAGGFFWGGGGGVFVFLFLLVFFCADWRSHLDRNQFIASSARGVYVCVLLCAWHPDVLSECAAW